MALDFPSSVRLISESLSLVDRFGANPIEVRDVRMADRTLVVEIVARSVDGAAVRGEIAGVMGALSGLDVPDLFPLLEVQSFGVRAFDAAGHELLWIVSSIEAAEFAAHGQPIEWLGRSVIQENTAEHRRLQADRIIGQIETALRDLVDHHGNEVSQDTYLDLLWPAARLENLRENALDEGHDDDDPRRLLDFAYLPELGQAIVRHIGWFRDGCIGELSTFEGSITRLNRMRRIVAHHRHISDEDLHVCREVREEVLARIGRIHPNFAVDFLVDRWESQVEELVAIAKATVQSPVVPDRGVVTELERRKAAIAALETQLSGVNTAFATSERLVVPPQRRELHDTLVRVLTRWRDALEKLVTAARRPDLTPSTAEAAGTAYEAALGEMQELYEQIKAIRVGASLE